MIRIALFPAALAALAACSSASSPETEDGLTRLERIGKAAFMDATLSEPAGTSCASCHAPATAFAGNNGSAIGVASGSGGALGLRNTPSAMYAAFIPPFAFVDRGEGFAPLGGQFHDGRADTLEAQVRGPLFNPIEMNNGGAARLAAKLARTSYAAALTAEFGAEVWSSPDRTVDALAAAIAAFERSKALSPFTSKYDAVVAGRAQWSAQEARGLALFMAPDKGNCIACHVADPKSRRGVDSLFTDYSYDNLGVPRNAAIPANADPAFFDLGLCGPQRIAVDDRALCGAFKVPTLRNATRKARFMHNGYFSSLRDVVSFYATRDTNPWRWYRGGVKFDDLPPEFRGNVNTSEVPYDRHEGESPRLSESEIDDLVAFLAALEDGYR